MSDTTVIILVAAALVGFLCVVAALWRGWSGWLALRHAELDQRGQPAVPVPGSPAGRIALADLKERVRRLEAIANGDA
jgi:hypothetical protein